MAFGKALLLTMLASVSVTAQDRKVPVPLRLSVFSESTSIPFLDGIVGQPIHPGLSVGTEWALKQGAHSRLVQGASMGYYYHKNLTQGAFIGTDFRYEINLPLALYVAAGIGLGYLHTFRTSDKFRLEEGQYVLKKDRGNPHAQISLPLEIGVRLKSGSASSPRLFVQYQPWIEYPFSPGFIPLMTHTNLVFGYTFFPFR